MRGKNGTERKKDGTETERNCDGVRTQMLTLLDDGPMIDERKLFIVHIYTIYCIAGFIHEKLRKCFISRHISIYKIIFLINASNL